MKAAIFLLLLALLVYTFSRVRRQPSQRARDLAVVRRTPIPRDVQLRAQAADDEEAKRTVLAEIRNCATLTEGQAEVAFELLRHGERLQEH